MIKLLPFILVAFLILGGLGYWRFFAAKQSLQTPTAKVLEEPVEVPQALPDASVEDRVKSLEETITSVVNKINAQPTPQADPSLDSRLKSVEAVVTELKAKVSSLENAPSAPAAVTSKAPLYIPLGSGGQISDTNWTSLNSFQVSLDPVSYSGYTSMQLEVNMRLNQPGGQVSARLYNSSTSSVVSSEISSTSTTSSVVTSAPFTLPTGVKTYILQAKSKDGNPTFIDYARIKVNF